MPQPRGHHQTLLQGSIERTLPPLAHWVWFSYQVFLFPVNDWILCDFVGRGHPVLKAPPLAVRKDEIERNLRM